VEQHRAPADLARRERHFVDRPLRRIDPHHVDQAS
jgi:hypothetical protein